MQFTWLASWPRSGNTLLRTVLHHCFDLKSASAYPADLAGNAALERHVGHIEQGEPLLDEWQRTGLALMKTHELPADDHRAIYVVRDGRAAAVSLWQFYRREIPLADVIAGKHRFGSWQTHLDAWHPETRADTLLLRYEDMVADLPQVLQQLSAFLDRPILQRAIPTREEIASSDGKWVRRGSDWREHMTPADEALFAEVNGAAMARLAYT